MNARGSREAVEAPEFAAYARWERFTDAELDVLSHCIRLPRPDDQTWHEAWILLGQINVEVERRRL